MKPSFSIGSLGFLCSICFFIGCGARAEVLSDKLKNQLDELVGKMDVKKKEIENQMKQLQTTVETLKEAKIKNEVKLERLDQKIKPMEEKRNAIKNALSEFSVHVSATEAVEIKGKSYSPEEVKSSLKELVEGFKSWDAKISSYQPAIESLRRVATMQEKQLATYQSKYSEMKMQMETLEARYDAVKVMKEAKVTAGGEDFSDSIAGMQESIDDLSDEVETALRLEDSKLKELESEVQDSKLDQLIDDASGSDQLSKDLEAILGKSE